MYRVILFDLDGTLTDSGEGITKSVQYAMEKMGKGSPALEELYSFVGPPLKEQFMNFFQLSGEEADQAVAFYRERYNLVGLYENKPYQGIEKVLSRLKAQGYRLGIASSKPEYFVKKIADYFHLSQYFEVIAGSELSGSRTNKTEVVEEALSRFGCQDRREEVVLVGDRKFDVYGARAAGVDCVAVTYGYGSLRELQEAGPVAIVSTMDQLEELFRVENVFPEGLLKRVWRVIYPPFLYLLISLMTSIALTIPLVLFHAGTEVITKSSMWSTALAGFIMVPVAHFMIKDDQYRRNPLKRVKGGISLQGGIWMLALGSSLAYVVNVIMALLRIFELFPGYSEGTSQAIYSNSFLVTAFCGAIVAPVAEEYLFRGLVYGRIRDYLGVKWGIVLSALIFGAFHGNMAQFIYAGLLGLVFAWALEYYQTITAPILLHVAANLWSFVLSYFATPLEKIGNGLLLGVVLCVQFVVVILSLVFIIRQKRED